VACNWRTRGWELRARWVENPLKKAEMLQHVGACRRAGSYISLLNYIGYISWRCCEESTVIASMTNYLSPTGIRQIVTRLARTARMMGFETPAQHNRKHGPRKRSNRDYRKPFRFMSTENSTVAAWRYSYDKPPDKPPPAEMTAKDIQELVVWR